MKDRILKLLIAGMKASEVAVTVGCSPAYISQLIKDEAFLKAIEAGKIESAQKNTEDEHLEDRYTTLKHKILNNIEQALPNAELPQLVRALEVVDKVQETAKNRKAPIPVVPVGGNIYIANIALPAHALMLPTPAVQVNEKNEIIAIDNQPLAPMSSTGVKNIFQQLRDRNTVSALPSEIIEQL